MPGEGLRNLIETSKGIKPVYRVPKEGYKLITMARKSMNAVAQKEAMMAVSDFFDKTASEQEMFDAIDYIEKEAGLLDATLRAARTIGQTKAFKNVASTASKIKNSGAMQSIGEGITGTVNKIKNSGALQSMGKGITGAANKFKNSAPVSAIRETKTFQDMSKDVSNVAHSFKPAKERFSNGIKTIGQGLKNDDLLKGNKQIGIGSKQIFSGTHKGARGAWNAMSDKAKGATAGVIGATTIAGLRQKRNNNEDEDY